MSSRTKRALAVAVGLACIVAVVYLYSGNSSPAPVEPAAELAVAPAAVPDTPAPVRAAVRPLPDADGYTVPPRPITRREHRWGESPEFFIRQPIDYPGNMPERMGDKISMFVYDLEVVKEAVRTGNEDTGRFAEVLGRTLTTAERNAARTELQTFFDDMVPVMDDLMDELITLEDGYVVIRYAREDLNAALRAAMNLDENEWYALYPHIAPLDRRLDQFDQSLADNG